MENFFFNFISTLIPVKGSSYISQAPIIFIDSAFYVIGGTHGTNEFLDVVGKLDAATKVWSKSGELVWGRFGHNAIFDGSSILVVGGEYFSIGPTERCSFLNEKITCSDQEPSLYDYYAYPELFLIPENFCKNLL